jgi:linoleoyl-CoA desaturase
MATPKFAVSTLSIHTDLKKRVNKYFLENNIAPTGNVKLYIKAAILLISYISIYIHLVFFTPPAFLAIAECLLLGFVTAGIGFNIMHDGGHGSFSKNPGVNTIAAFTADIMGASSFMWNTKHNVIHHAYTNIEGIDDDIDAGDLLRFNHLQKYRPFHRYQHLYVWPLYSLLYLAWVFFGDYKKYFTRKVGDVALKKLSVKDHILFWTFKVCHLTVFVVLPIIYAGFLPWLTGFLIFSMSTGLLLSLVFQLAHVLGETSFPEPLMPANTMEDEWALHQLKTTANFATKNKLITWWTGGLNFQVEHHLFPKISHIHYPAISKIIKERCRELRLPYLEHRTMIEATVSHVKFLKKLGRKEYSFEN